MALPKKKDIRKITIDGRAYYWKVGDDYRDLQGLVVTVGMVITPHKRFIFDFRFDYENLQNSTTTVTPSLIKQSIAFAKQHFSWGENHTCHFKFEKDTFQVIEE